jgi:hypothetical protein
MLRRFLSSVWTNSTPLLNLVQTLALLIGGAFALWQFSEHQRSERVARTLDFNRQLFSGVALKYGSTAQNLFDTTISQYIDTMPNLKNETQEARDLAYKTILKENTNKEMIQSLVFFDDFLRQVQACVQNNACDSRTAFALFDRIGKSFHVNTFPLLKDFRQSGYTGFGESWCFFRFHGDVDGVVC